jgi:riboflavin kinase
LKTLRVKGVVLSGKGEGATFIELPWVKKQIIETLDFVPHSGTLNLKLTKEELTYRNLLEKGEAIEVSPAKGFSRGRCFKAELANNLECAIVIPDIPNYPEGVIEIIAPTNLRKKLNLKDGDSVDVKILPR